MVALQKPAPWANDLPRQAPVETTVWVITAVLTDYKIEQDIEHGTLAGGDSDYHLALADVEHHTMMAEISLPSCVPQGSPSLPWPPAPRLEFDSRLRATPPFQRPTTP